MVDDLNKKIEKEIKVDVENEIKEEIEKKLDKKLGKKLEKELKPEIEKEVRKRIHERVYESTIKFKKEFQNQVVVAISAALGFLIALSWRTPIQDGVDSLINHLELSGGAIYLQFLSALIVTSIAVLILMWVSKWKSGDGKSR